MVPANDTTKAPRDATNKDILYAEYTQTSSQFQEVLKIYNSKPIASDQRTEQASTPGPHIRPKWNEAGIWKPISSEQEHEGELRAAMDVMLSYFPPGERPVEYSPLTPPGGKEGGEEFPFPSIQGEQIAKVKKSGERSEQSKGKEDKNKEKINMQLDHEDAKTKH